MSLLVLNNIQWCDSSCGWLLGKLVAVLMMKRINFKMHCSDHAICHHPLSAPPTKISHWLHSISNGLSGLNNVNLQTQIWTFDTKIFS